jgi:hypothetical protein
MMRQTTYSTMGGKSSKEASTANARLPEDESAPISESAVVLEENLQKKILQDFQSTVIKQEWEKRQQYFLAKNSQRRLGDLEFQEALNQRMAAVRQQQASVQKQLDEKAEALQARFADISIGLKHDADKLEKENLSIQPRTGSSQPCLNVRKKLASCYKRNQGEPSNCDALVNELGACIELEVDRINAQGRPVQVLSDS